MAVESKIIDLITKIAKYPGDSVFNRVIAKDEFIRRGQFKGQKKQEFKDFVSQVNWVLLLTDKNTNVPEFVDDENSYKELDYIHVKTKCDFVVKTVAEIIFSTINKPLILQITYPNGDDLANRWVVAEYVKKKKNAPGMTAMKLHYSDAVTENTLADFIATMSFENQQRVNLKAFYISLIQNVERFNYEQTTGHSFRDGEEDVSAVNQRISELEQQIKNLKIAASREKQINSRMNLIKKSRTIINELKALKGEY